MEHFQHVRSTSYLLKAFGILYMLIQPGHKYSNPPTTLCHVNGKIIGGKERKNNNIIIQSAVGGATNKNEGKRGRGVKDI